MFSKIFSLLFLALIFTGTSQVYGKCINVNLPVTGIITSEEDCSIQVESADFQAETTDFNGAQCLQGTINLNPPYTIEMLRTGSGVASNNIIVKYASSRVIIKNQNGAEIFGTNAASTNTETGHSAELLNLSGGTGPFVNTTGELVVDAKYNYENGTYTASMKGQVCLN